VSAPHQLSAVWADADRLRAQGNLTAARDLLEPVADVASIRLGADDPDVIETMRRLATVQRELGELAAARRVLEETLEGAQLRLGDDDPVILAISAELGVIADELGNRHEARRNLTRVARYGPAVLGPDHPYVRTAQRYLGADAPLPAAPPQAQATLPGAQATLPAEPQATLPRAPAAPAPAPAPQARTPIREEPGVYRPAPRPDDLPVPSAHPSSAPPPTWAGTPPDRARPDLARPDLARPDLAPPDREWPAPVEAGEQSAPEADEPYFDGEPGRSRTSLIAVAVAAVVVVVAAIVAVIALGGPRSTPSTAPPKESPSASATPAQAPPTVRLRDNGGSITLSWTDPSGGKVPFVVAGGIAGGAAQPFPPLPPGQLSYTLNGLNPKLDYCFTVGAVYSTDVVTLSSLVCTRRNLSPSPTTS
jgi:hypothetical protein